jgi:hypothetical protein
MVGKIVLDETLEGIAVTTGVGVAVTRSGITVETAIGVTIDEDNKKDKNQFKKLFIIYYF